MKNKSVLNSRSCLFRSITLSLKEELPMSYQSIGLIVASSQRVKNQRLKRILITFQEFKALTQKEKHAVRSEISKC
jgi:hypothetical protein